MKNMFFNFSCSTCILHNSCPEKLPSPVIEDDPIINNDPGIITEEMLNGITHADLQETNRSWSMRWADKMTHWRGKLNSQSCKDTAVFSQCHKKWSLFVGWSFKNRSMLAEPLFDLENLNDLWQLSHTTRITISVIIVSWIVVCLGVCRQLALISSES